MLPQDVALLVQKRPVGIGLSRVAADKGGIVPVGDEADVLALVLFRVDESLLGGDGPDLVLGQVPQGEQTVDKLVLGQVIQHIALVLLRVEGLVQQPPAAASVIA